MIGTSIVNDVDHWDIVALEGQFDVFSFFGVDVMELHFFSELIVKHFELTNDVTAMLGIVSLEVQDVSLVSIDI